MLTYLIFSDLSYHSERLHIISHYAYHLPSFRLSLFHFAVLYQIKHDYTVLYIIRYRPSSRWMAMLTMDEFIGIDVSQRLVSQSVSQSDTVQYHPSRSISIKKFRLFLFFFPFLTLLLSSLIFRPSLFLCFLSLSFLIFAFF